MKKYILITWMILLNVSAFAQTGNFVVQGDADKFYPVVFQDNNWDNNKPTELQLGRSSVHWDGLWHGSLMTKFVFHTSRYGNGAGFVNAVIWQRYGGDYIGFVASYRVGNANNNSLNFIIWLKGSTSYAYSSNTAQSPIVYDGVQQSLPFQEENGPAHTFKQSVDSYINSWGKTYAGSAYFLGGDDNYINGNLGIGTLNPAEKLSVNGKIRAREIKVETANWPDYVFRPEYELPTLAEVEKCIKTNGRLPDMPSAKEVEANGLELGELVKQQQKKIEELTLYLIEQNKRIDMLDKQIKHK
ncbi:hypothetical protein [Pedobacter sp. MW01-1-1]|uniref:hypothetical protein n=1 Tax=Pedobacter sp. MW01-1-1 TaxID=3383027 RepID=UPI003FF0EE25